MELTTTHKVWIVCLNQVEEKEEHKFEDFHDIYYEPVTRTFLCQECFKKDYVGLPVDLHRNIEKYNKFCFREDKDVIIE